MQIYRVFIDFLIQIYLLFNTDFLIIFCFINTEVFFLWTENEALAHEL